MRKITGRKTRITSKAQTHSADQNGFSCRRSFFGRTALLCALLLTAGCLFGCGTGAKQKSAPKAASEKQTSADAAFQKQTSADAASQKPAAAADHADAAASTGAAASADTAPASQTAQSAEPAGDTGTGAVAAQEPRKLRYIDAWDEWHTMEVDPDVKASVYDASLFVHPEENPQWVVYTGDGYECLQGIDVSEHQGTIDWQAVADAGYRFAFIRVGYRGYGEAGTLQEDAMAVENLRGAKEAGLFVGTYFFSQALNEKEASEEASLAVSVIEKSGVEPDLPLMYDPELIRDDQGRANEITRDQVALNTKAFRETVEASSSCRADIYSNLPWEHHYFDTATMNSFDIWYADYEPQPQTPYHFTWWQYTNEGTVPGIDGYTDLNLWLR